MFDQKSFFRASAFRRRAGGSIGDRFRHYQWTVTVGG